MTAGDAKAKDHATIAHDLLGYVRAACPGIEVLVDRSPRWNRTCLTFRWAGFSGLLPEERFRILARQIPQAYIDQHCTGAVWLELAPGEDVDHYLALPRCEDVADQTDDVLRELARTDFFAVLEDELARVLPDKVEDNLSVTRRILSARAMSAQGVQTVCLVLIGCGAYNDWSVLRAVRPVAEQLDTRKDKTT